MMFMSEFCEQCRNQNPDPDKDPQCDILMRTLIHDTDHPDYPEEWTYDPLGNPTCTAHIGCNWNDDDDDGGDPKGPTSNDPNQLMMFSPFDDLINKDTNVSEHELTRV